MPKTSTTAQRNAKKRRLAQSQYRTLRLQKRLKHPSEKLPPAWRLFARSIKQLGTHWKLFIGIVIVYGVLSLILVRGFGVNSSLPQTKLLLQALFKGFTGKLNTGITLFGVLLGSNTAASDAASAYQSMLVIVTSLAIIWALRQSYTKTRTRIRDAFYKGMSPLVPFVLVIVVIALQLLPLVIANLLYGFVFSGGIAITVIEKVLWGMLLFLLALLTLYMITSSLFALYIVTLPNISPLQALRSARGLVRFRRWTVMRKVLFLPIMLLIMAGVILIPVILYATPIAEWLYFALTIIALVVFHAYLYALYRELIV